MPGSLPCPPPKKRPQPQTEQNLSIKMSRSSFNYYDDENDRFTAGSGTGPERLNDKRHRTATRMGRTSGPISAKNRIDDKITGVQRCHVTKRVSA